MPEGLPDFTQVHNLTLDTFILNLKMRYESEQIYSYIGESLIAVNPYEVIECLETELSSQESRRA